VYEMKKYKIIIGVLICLVIISSFVLIRLYSGGDKEGKIVVELFEKKASDEEILNMTDVVVRGKILEKIDEIEYEGKTLNMVYSEYKFEVIEDYMDILETNEIVISYMGTQLPSGIEMNEEYILYLIQNKSTDYESDNIFSFVSLLQGIYKYDNGWRNDIGDEFNTKLLRSE